MLAENFFLCIAAPLCIALLFIKDDARRFCAFFLTGITVCLLCAYVGSFLVAITGFSVDDAAVYITPISEELMKVMPLFFYYLVFEPSNNCLLTAAAAVGAGFATFENCFYLLSTDTVALSYLMIRGLAVGVMHIVCSMAPPMVLSLFRESKGITGTLIMGMLAAVVAYHGLYNLLVSAPGISRAIGYALPLCTVAATFPLLRLRRSLLKHREATTE